MTLPVATWNPSLIQTVTNALITVGAIQEDEVPTAADLNVAMYKIQNWIKAQQASGLHVWTEEEAILFLQAGQSRYLLGTGTADHCCDAYSYVPFQLASTAAAGSTVIAIAALAQIPNPGVSAAIGDNIGVVLDSGIAFWTTVANIVGTVVTLAAPLPSQASALNIGFDYPPSAAINRPLEVPKSRYLTWNGLAEVPIYRLSRQEYMDLPNKNNLWNTVQTAATWAMRFTWYRSIGDWATDTSTADFPQEWAAAIEWNLAEEVMVGYDVPPQRAQMISAMAKKHLDIVQGYDRESEDISFGIARIE